MRPSPDEIAHRLRGGETRDGETRIACAFPSSGPQPRRGAGSAAPPRPRTACKFGRIEQLVERVRGSSASGQNFAVRVRMKTNRWVAVLVAMVLMPAALLWGAFLLIPAALLLVPCVLLVAIAAVPALLVAATSPRHDTARREEPVSTTPVYTST